MLLSPIMFSMRQYFKCGVLLDCKPVLLVLTNWQIVLSVVNPYHSFIQKFYFLLPRIRASRT